MRIYTIGVNHIEQLHTFEVIGSWLQSERERLTAALNYVNLSEQQLSMQLSNYLQQTYNVPPGAQITLDTKQALILTDEPNVESDESSPFLTRDVR